MSAVIIIALILAIVIPLAIAHGKKTNQAWADAARTLGLSYRPGGFLQSRRIEGNLKELRVVVDTFTRSSGKNSTTYTRYRVNFPRSLSLGLQLQREGMLSSVSKFFGAQDIQVGDASFDNSMLIKGRNAVAIREFLTPARRMRIQHFIAGRREAVIDDVSIRYTKVGIVSKSPAIVASIQSMSRLAWHLIGERDQDSRLQQAMQLQNEGDPEAALRVIERSVQEASPAKGGTDSEPVEAFLVNPVEEKRMQGELFYLSGDRKQAHHAFQEVQRDDPDDEEVADWLELTSDEPSQSVETASDENVVVAEAAPTAATSADKGQGESDDRAEVHEPVDPTKPIERSQFCDELFGDDVRSFDVNSRFERRYQGRTVQWSGELKKLERNYSSFIFEQSGGTKATFKIDERPSPYYGTHDVLAIVHLSEAEGEQLKDRVGQTIGFTGELVKADGLMRNVYLDHGQTT